MVSDSLIGERQADYLPSGQTVLNAMPLVIGLNTEPVNDLLSQSILEVLRLIWEGLAMDMVLVTMHIDDNMVIRHPAISLDEPNFGGMSHHRDLSICQRVPEGRLPAVITDMAAPKRTHDVPLTPIVPAAFMAVPVVLASGRRYGVLCCLKSTPMLELDECHHRSLEMSAQHIARRVDEAGCHCFLFLTDINFSAGANPSHQSLNFVQR